MEQLKIGDRVNRDTRREMNRWGAEGVPFLFLLDFEMEKPFALPLSQIDEREILFSIGGKGNLGLPPAYERKFYFCRRAMGYADYRRAFDLVQEEQRRGNSFLLNLTFPTPVDTDVTLEDFAVYSNAPCRIALRGQFSCFSPEYFVRIKKDKILSCPMKGTIGAEPAENLKLLMKDEKELAEHVTVVDLIRNDLSRVAKNVRVERFRYASPITAHGRRLWGTSSDIVGDLPSDWRKRLGDILWELLPAGSISGAPKRKTLEIIRRAEGMPRGYFTGVFGVYDGEELDSAVLIRYVEQTPRGLTYRSGGGITVYSEGEREYREMLEKVYVPFSRDH